MLSALCMAFWWYSFSHCGQCSFRYLLSFRDLSNDYCGPLILITEIRLAAVNRWHHLFIRAQIVCLYRLQHINLTLGSDLNSLISQSSQYVFFWLVGRSYLPSLFCFTGFTSIAKFKAIWLLSKVLHFQRLSCSCNGSLGGCYTMDEAWISEGTGEKNLCISSVRRSRKFYLARCLVQQPVVDFQRFSP